MEWDVLPIININYTFSPNNEYLLLIDLFIPKETRGEAFIRGKVIESIYLYDPFTDVGFKAGEGTTKMQTIEEIVELEVFDGNSSGTIGRHGSGSENNSIKTNTMFWERLIYWKIINDEQFIPVPTYFVSDQARYYEWVESMIPVRRDSLYIEWLDNETVQIDDKILNIKLNRYDYRRDLKSIFQELFNSSN